MSHRTIIGFGEMLAILGRDVPGGAEIRSADAIGASLPAVANPWFDAVIVPPGAEPPADRPDLPLCVWSAAGPVPGRVTAPHLVMPAMALDFGADLPVDPAPLAVETPPAATLGAIGDRAYGDAPTLALLAPHLADPRLAFHGVRVGGDFACVAATLALGDHVCFHYVATEKVYRGRGLASRLMLALLHDMKARGFTAATLQASKDGLPIYERLGFRTEAVLRGYVRA